MNILLIVCAVAVWLVGCASAGKTSSSPNPGAFAGSGDDTGGGGSNSSVAGSNSGVAGSDSSAGGSAGAAPIAVVNNCGKLAAPGVWEHLDPSNGVEPGGSGILAVVVDPLNTSVVYATSDKRGAYRSADCGATWNKINTGTNGSILDSGSEWLFMIDPTDSNTMYSCPLFGTDQRLFKSTNKGKDWAPLFQPGDNVESAFDRFSVQDLAIEPTNHQHLAVTFHENCNPPHTKLCMGESTDGGKTWALIDGPPSLAGWTEDAGPYVSDASTLFFAASFDGLFRTTDKGKTWARVAQEAYPRIFRSADGYSYMGSAQLPLQRSKDLVTWETIDGTPSSVSAGLAEDGQRLFLATRSGIDYRSSPQSDGRSWTKLEAPPVTAGPRMMAYDTVNHVLYSGNLQFGLWRMRTY